MLCARTDFPGVVKGKITLTSHLEMVSLEAGVHGDQDRIKSESEDLRFLVFSTYHFSALTGKTYRPSGMEEAEDIVGRNIGPGVNCSV